MADLDPIGACASANTVMARVSMHLEPAMDIHFAYDPGGQAFHLSNLRYLYLSCREHN